MLDRTATRIGDVLGLAPQSGLAEIEVRRAQIAAALQANRAERRALLLGDASDRRIAASDAEADRLHLAYERLEAAEQHLRMRQVAGPQFQNFQARPR